MKIAVSVSILALCLLNSCCSSCNRFWDSVEAGDFYDEALQSKVENALETRTPTRFKSVARVLLTRSSADQAFSLYATVDRSRKTMSAAGLSDLGNVMFAVTSAADQVIVKKNNSGWDDEVLTHMLVPMLTTVFLPEPRENAIVQDGLDTTLMHRSLTRDGDRETFVFRKTDMRWQTYTLRQVMLFGTIDRLQRIEFSEFKDVPGCPSPYPHRVDIADGVHGFKARVDIGSVTAL